MLAESCPTAVRRSLNEFSGRRMAVFHAFALRNQPALRRLFRNRDPVHSREDIMGMGKGLLLWMLGIPLPIIILLAIFWH
jgi:hypothetical protein